MKIIDEKFIRYQLGDDFKIFLEFVKRKGFEVNHDYFTLCLLKDFIEYYYPETEQKHYLDNIMNYRGILSESYIDKHQKYYRSVQDRLLLMESLGIELQEKLRDYENLSEEDKRRFSFNFEKLVKNFFHVRCDVYDLYEEGKK